MRCFWTVRESLASPRRADYIPAMRTPRSVPAPLTFFVFLLLPTIAANAQEKSPNRFEKGIQAFEKADVATPPAADSVLFIGSSSIRMWKTLAEDFPGTAVINRGFGGSEISDQLHFFDRIVPVYKPRKIVIFCGENDIWRDETPEAVYADFRTFVDRASEALPGVPIGFIELKPSPARSKKWAAYQKCNGLIRAYCKDQPMLRYFDVSLDMLDATGAPRTELFVKDQLHMTREGYRLWAERVRPWVNAPP